MAGFDHRCPYCNADIDVHRHWGDRDYSTSFQLECECGRKVQVDVAMEPIFETSKPACLMCSKAEANSSGHYCDECLGKLNELSKYNGGK